MGEMTESIKGPEKTETELIKEAFAGRFPEASKAISVGTKSERMPALAMYDAFGQGWIARESRIAEELDAFKM